MIKNALNTYARSLNKVWEHDRSKSIGASEVGQCSRKIWYAKVGTKVDAAHVDGYGARLRGDLIERHFFNEALHARYGTQLMFAGADQKTFHKGHLSATPDGLLVRQDRDCLNYLKIADIGKGGCFLVDCKSIDPRIDLQKEKAEHAYQVQVQLGLVRDTSEWQPEYAVLVYINASFLDDVTEYAVKFDPKIYEIAEKRAAITLASTDAKELKPEGWIAGGRECQYCSWADRCGVTRQTVPRDAGPKQLDPQFVAELKDLCGVYTRARDNGDKAEVERREAVEAIKERLRDKNVKKVPGLVTWSEVKGRFAWDDKAVREYLTKQGVDIEKFSRVGTPTDRLTVD